MTIEIDTAMVSRAAAEIREDVEAATRRGNASLADCTAACAGNPGFQVADALTGCLDSWDGTLADLFTTTVQVAADLSATAQSVDYTDDTNARAAAALKGLL